MSNSNAWANESTSMTHDELRASFFRYDANDERASVCNNIDATIYEDVSERAICEHLEQIRRNTIIKRVHFDHPPMPEVQRTIVAFKDGEAQARYYAGRQGDGEYGINYTCHVREWDTLTYPLDSPGRSGKVGLSSSKVRGGGDDWHYVVVVWVHNGDRDDIWIYDPYLEEGFASSTANALRLKTIPGLSVVRSWIEDCVGSNPSIWIAGGGWYQDKRWCQRLSLFALIYAAALLMSPGPDVHKKWGREGSVMMGPRDGRWMRLGYDWVKVMS